MILFRYLAKEILLTAVVVTFVVLLVFLSNEFVHLLTQVVAGKLALSNLMQMVSLEMPFLLGYILPIGIFLAIMLAFGRLYADSEMTVFRACGIGQTQVISMTLLAILPLMLLVAYLVLWVGPQVTSYQQRLLASQGQKLLLDSIAPGRFKSVSHGMQVYYVQNVSRDKKRLNDVFSVQIQLPKKRGDFPRWTVITGKNAYQTIDAATGDRKLVINKGYRYQGFPGQNNYDITQYDAYATRFQDKSSKLGYRVKAVPTGELWAKKNTDLRLEAEWQWRISMPLYIIVLVLLAVPLSRLKPRQGKFAKLLPAILIFVIYANMMFVARDWVEDGAVPAALGLWSIHLPMLLLAIWLLSYDTLTRWWTWRRQGAEA